MAAIWGNSNFESLEKIEEVADALDQRYTLAIEALYGNLPTDKEAKIDPDDPFWQAMERGVQKHALPKVEV